MIFRYLRYCFLLLLLMFIFSDNVFAVVCPKCEVENNENNDTCQSCGGNLAVSGEDEPKDSSLPGTVEPEEDASMVSSSHRATTGTIVRGRSFRDPSIGERIYGTQARRNYRHERKEFEMESLAIPAVENAVKDVTADVKGEVEKIRTSVDESFRQIVEDRSKDLKANLGEMKTEMEGVVARHKVDLDSALDGHKEGFKDLVTNESAEFRRMADDQVTEALKTFEKELGLAKAGVSAAADRSRDAAVRTVEESKDKATRSVNQAQDEAIRLLNEKKELAKGEYDKRNERLDEKIKDVKDEINVLEILVNTFRTKLNEEFAKSSDLSHVLMKNLIPNPGLIPFLSGETGYDDGLMDTKNGDFTVFGVGIPAGWFVKKQDGGRYKVEFLEGGGVRFKCLQEGGGEQGLLLSCNKKITPSQSGKTFVYGLICDSEIDRVEPLFYKDGESADARVVDCLVHTDGLSKGRSEKWVAYGPVQDTDIVNVGLKITLGEDEEVVFYGLFMNEYFDVFEGIDALKKTIKSPADLKKDFDCMCHIADDCFEGNLAIFRNLEKSFPTYSKHSEFFLLDGDRPVDRTKYNVEGLGSDEVRLTADLGGFGGKPRVIISSF